MCFHTRLHPGVAGPLEVFPLCLSAGDAEVSSVLSLCPPDGIWSGSNEAKLSTLTWSDSNQAKLSTLTWSDSNQTKLSTLTWSGSNQAKLSTLTWSGSI